MPSPFKVKTRSVLMVIALMATQIVIPTRQAEASVASACTPIPRAVLLGLELQLFVGGVIIANMDDTCQVVSGMDILSGVMGTLGGVGTLFGIILLDNKGQSPKLAFPQLSLQQKTASGLSETEFRAYRANLDTIHAISDLVSSDLNDSNQITPKYAQERWSAHARDFGVDRTPELQDAFRGAQKFSAYMVRAAIQLQRAEVKN